MAACSFIFLTAYSNDDAILNWLMPGKSLILKDFRALVTLTAVGCNSNLYLPFLGPWRTSFPIINTINNGFLTITWHSGSFRRLVCSIPSSRLLLGSDSSAMCPHASEIGSGSPRLLSWKPTWLREHIGTIRKWNRWELTLTADLITALQPKGKRNIKRLLQNCHFAAGALFWRFVMPASSFR